MFIAKTGKCSPSCGSELWGCSSGVDLLCAPDGGGGLCCKQQSSDPWQGVCNYIPSGNASLTRAEIGMESKEETSATVAGSTGL